MARSGQFREEFKHNLAAEVLRTTGSLRLAAFGCSMLPTIWPGDLLSIQSQTFDDVQPGDVVLFTRKGRFFVHRILRKIEVGRNQRLITRGDGMPSVDAPVSPGELLGKVIAVDRTGTGDSKVLACSTWRRFLGLGMAYSSVLRGVALRWHTRRSPAPKGQELTSEEVSVS